MKLVTFGKDGQARVGALVDDVVIDLRQAARERGLRVCSTMLEDMNALLEGGDAALAEAQKNLAHGLEHEGCRLPLGDVELLAPLAPRKLFCLAGNYVKHIEEGSGGVKAKDKITPRLFLKPPTNTVIGPGAAIRIPAVARGIDWEAELVAVIGRRGKNVRREDALDHVAGYTAMNDVSERKLRIRERPESSEWDAFFDWLNGKWFDTFAPLGPCIVTADEIPDPHELDISLSVNGEQKQGSNTSHMIHRVDELIEYISTFITLEPGDVIATGTPEGTGDPVGVYLKPGDVVRVEIEKVGVLENSVEAEEPE